MTVEAEGLRQPGRRTARQQVLRSRNVGPESWAGGARGQASAAHRTDRDGRLLFRRPGGSLTGTRFKVAQESARRQGLSTAGVLVVGLPHGAAAGAGGRESRPPSELRRYRYGSGFPIGLVRLVARPPRMSWPVGLLRTGLRCRGPDKVAASGGNVIERAGPGIRTHGGSWRCLRLLCDQDQLSCRPRAGGGGGSGRAGAGAGGGLAGRVGLSAVPGGPIPRRGGWCGRPRRCGG
jgi:hypothetical protein